MNSPFEFLRPTALLLVPVVGLLWWLWRRRADPLRGWRAQMDAGLLEALSDQRGSPGTKSWPVLLAWLLAVVAVAGPSWQPEPSPFAEDATALVILLKADVSMDTPDPDPSRIERAHLLIRDLANARPNQRLGLIAYAGSAHLVLPPTKDTDAVATMAAEVSPAIMPSRGDRLDLAIDRAARLFGDEVGSLLVMTDTASSDTPALKQSHRRAGSPYTQIMAIAPPGASTDPLQPLARSLDAKLIPMGTDDTAIEQIVRNAARPPVARGADGSARRKDGGYYLVPFIAAFSLLPFRRKLHRPTEA